ncbi:MAG: nucleotidyl transferase AbiEii/AbiGii toxin family protein [Candidatus Paceibacterota bacterium]
METKFNLKYKKILEILADVGDCAQNRLILVGGTALALFYLKHRVSIDLDFIPIKMDEIKAKEEMKGCLTKKGYKTTVGRFKNQFILQFEDTSIKIEIFSTEYKIKKIENREIGNSTILVASIEDLLELKKLSYLDRKEARDLYDISFILKEKKSDFELIKRLIKTAGMPENIHEMEKMIENQDNLNFFMEVLKNAS